MPELRFRLRQRQAHRTRIQFPLLRHQASLCRLLEESLRAVAGVSRVEVRARTASIILEHPAAMVRLETVIALVNRICADSGPDCRKNDLLACPSTGRGGSCLSCSSQEDSGGHHVSGWTLVLTGLYLIFLFAKRLVTTPVTSTSLALRVFSLPALVTLGLSLPIQRQAMENLRRSGRPDMGLISTGLLYVALVTGNIFSAFTIFWLFNLSSWMEDRIRSRTRQAVRDMLAGEVRTVWLVKDASEIEVDVATLLPGDIITLRLGNTVPVDGEVVRGSALVNEAAMTGESLPVAKTSGATVLAGTVIEAGEIRVQVNKTGEATRLSAIIRLIENAEKQPGELQRESQRFSQIIVPVSLTFAAAAFLFTGSLMQAMAVLIITCPCALRLSTSVAVSSAMSKAASRGVLIKGGRYIEAAGRVDILVLDKTGTLTDMSSEVGKITVVDKRFKPESLLRMAASAQQAWPHPLSRAVGGEAVKRNLALPACEQSELVVGKGLRAMIGEKCVLIGSHRFMEENAIVVREERQTSQPLPSSGMTRLHIAQDGRLIGMIEARHGVRPEDADVFRQLRSLGIKRIVLLTGDTESGTAGLREIFDFDEVRCNQSPEDKAMWINDWKKTHPDDVVAMVGDGINDTPAFAAADLSFAMGEAGADVTVEYADIVLQRGGIDNVVFTLALGRTTLKTIKESYAMAIGLNAATLALTTTGLLSPVGGAFVHNFITLAAVSNAATLRRFDEKAPSTKRKNNGKTLQ
jgi:cation-transporting P-type ATPase C